MLATVLPLQDQMESPLFGNLRFFVLAATEAQVDNLIAAGRELLRGNTEFQRFIKDAGNR